MIEFKDFASGLFSLLTGPAVTVFICVGSWFGVYATLHIREDWLAMRRKRLRDEEAAQK